MKKKSLRFATASAISLGAAVALALAVPLSASAHVTIDENTAEPGSYALVTFKVPNESGSATTNTITLDLPTDTPFASVRFVPVAGWSTELVRTTLPEPVQVGETELTEAVTQVIWTADDGVGVGAGELGLFPLSLGPVPDVGSIVLPVDQSYTDGSVVSWNEEGDDAEHPAPVLYVNDAPVADHHGGGDGESAEHSDAEHADAAGSETHSGSDGTGVALGVAGLTAGLAGLVVGIIALLRTRKQSA